MTPKTKQDLSTKPLFTQPRDDLPYFICLRHLLQTDHSCGLAGSKCEIQADRVCETSWLLVCTVRFGDSFKTVEMFLFVASSLYVARLFNFITKSNQLSLQNTNRKRLMWHQRRPNNRDISTLRTVSCRTRPMCLSAYVQYIRLIRYFKCNIISKTSVSG